MIVVGLSGRIGHGKDAVAERLVSRWGFAVVRFSEALKLEVMERLPRTLAAIHEFNCERCYAPDHIDLEHVRADVYDRKPPGVRELLQEYGTEVRRRDQPDYWVGRWATAAQRHRRVVAPDVRFPNEYAAIRAARGSLWRVVRPGIEAPALLHESETALDDHPWDAILQNDGGREHLHELVDELIVG